MYQVMCNRKVVAPRSMDLQTILFFDVQLTNFTPKPDFALGAEDKAAVCKLLMDKDY